MIPEYTSCQEGCSGIPFFTVLMTVYRVNQRQTTRSLYCHLKLASTFEVSGDKIEAIYMIPGWTHNIINLSETDDLVTVMTCNEIFDPGHPDTFFEPV